MNEFRMTSECHLIELEYDSEHFIAYFPLKSLVLKVNSTAATSLQNLKRGPVVSANASELEFLRSMEALKVVNGPTDILPDSPCLDTPLPISTLLLLTDRCNLRCLYCYAGSDARGDDMPLEIGEAAIDTIIENSLKQKARFIDVGFHGGGEPTLNWDVLTGIIQYAEEQCQQKGIALQSTICSNGIVAEKQVMWLAEHIQSITISIDGLPQVQNYQRPLPGGGASFDQVARTIDILDSQHKQYVLRVTATAASEVRLADIYKFLTSRFHPVSVCIEPLFVCGRCINSQCQPPLAETFVKDLKEILDLSRQTKVSLQYSGGRLFTLDTRFCGAAGSNFFVTPRGDVTACVEVSRRQDPRADVLMYGKYNAYTEKFDFNIANFQRLVHMRVYDFNTCVDCFARWHCCGDCLAKAPALARIKGERNLYRCAINRAFTKHQLMQELEGVVIGRHSTEHAS